MIYESIKIYNTDFSDKFLLKYQSRTLYVGQIIKDIVNQLKSDVSKEKLLIKINFQHKLNLNYEDLNDIISKLESSLQKKKNSSLLKLFRVLDPSRIPIPNKIKFIFREGLFYYILILNFLINIFGFYQVERITLDNSIDSITYYLGLVFILLLHEFGHAISAKNYMINTDEIGFGFYGFIPVFYIDLGESWKLSINKRVLVNLSGIHFQLLIGTLVYTLITFVHDSLLLSKLFYVNFVIVLVNLNPFFKFDGYWILSDLLKENNLITKSKDFIKNLFAFKIKRIDYKIQIYSILRIAFMMYILQLVLRYFINFFIAVFIDKAESFFTKSTVIVVSYILLFKIIQYGVRKREIAV